MAKVFADFQKEVDERTQDGAAKLGASARDACIREALTGRYSMARPLLKIKDLTGDGSAYKWTLDTTNFPGWVEGFSVVLDVAYPAGETNERTPPLVEKDEWIIYQVTSAARELRLLRATPASGKKVRVRYTALHAEDGTDAPDGDFPGVVNLAASIACDRLAAIYSQQGDSAIGADAVDHRQKASSFADLARQYEERFKEIFGLDKEEQQPASSVTAEWRQNLEEGSRRLTH